MLQSCFPVINKVQTMFTPIFITHKHTREPRIYVNPMSKNLNFFSFIDFYVSTKKLGKVGEKQSIMSLSM